MKVVPRLLSATLVTFVSDGLFATAQTYLRGLTFTRLWQGVAAVLVGPDAFKGGTTTVAIGLMMHLSVAFFWSAVFVLVSGKSAWLRRVLDSRGGVFKVAAVYGPAIWLVMSLIVIPVLTHRPPTITGRWWVQFFGHAIFVGLPIVSIIASSRTIASIRQSPATSPG